MIQEETFNDQDKAWGINVDFVGPNGKFNIGTGLNKTTSKNSRIARVNSDYAPPNVYFIFIKYEREKTFY